MISCPEHLNLESIRLLNGKRSEKLLADRRPLAFAALQGAPAEMKAEAAAGDPSPRSSPKRRQAERNIAHPLWHLERIAQVIEPESTLCLCGCGEVVRIGKGCTEHQDIVPIQMQVRWYRCVRNTPAAGASTASPRRRHRRG